MLTWRSYELAIRLCVAYASIITGTAFLFIGMTDTTADGQPFSYPLWDNSNLLFWSMPSLVAAFYLFLGKKFRILSWAFIGFISYWLSTVVKSYNNGEFWFIYWHQGDVVCTACDNRFFSLAAATFLFGVCVLVAVLVRSWRGVEVNKYSLSMGAVALFLLLFCTFAVGIS